MRVYLTLPLVSASAVSCLSTSGSRWPHCSCHVYPIMLGCIPQSYEPKQPSPPLHGFCRYLVTATKIATNTGGTLHFMTQWFSTHFGVTLQLSCISDIYATARGTVLKGSSMSKVENHCLTQREKVTSTGGPCAARYTVRKLQLRRDS